MDRAVIKSLRVVAKRQFGHASRHFPSYVGLDCRNRIAPQLVGGTHVKSFVSKGTHVKSFFSMCQLSIWECVMYSNMWFYESCYELANWLVGWLVGLGH